MRNVAQKLNQKMLRRTTLRNEAGFPPRQIGLLPNETAGRKRSTSRLDRKMKIPGFVKNGLCQINFIFSIFESIILQQDIFLL